jgi:hypothetical protein
MGPSQRPIPLTKYPSRSQPREAERPGSTGDGNKSAPTQEWPNVGPGVRQAMREGTLWTSTATHLLWAHPHAVSDHPRPPCSPMLTEEAWCCNKACQPSEREPESIARNVPTNGLRIRPIGDLSLTGEKGYFSLKNSILCPVRPSNAGKHQIRQAHEQGALRTTRSVDTYSACLIRQSPHPSAP